MNNRIRTAALVVAVSVTVGLISYHKGKDNGFMEAVENGKRNRVQRFNEKNQK